MNNVTMTSIIGNWNLDKTVNVSFYITMIMTAIIITIMAVTIIQFKKGYETKHKRISKIILVTAAVCAISSFVLMLTLNISYSIALKHGAYTKDMTIATMYDGISHTPVEDKLPEDLDGCIVVFYRFDCPDCKAIYEDLMAASANVENIYFVSSRSEQGSALIEQYPVPEVPYGIYLRRYTYNGALNYTRKKLFYIDENNTSVFNEANFNRLIVLQSEQK